MFLVPMTRSSAVLSRSFDHFFAAGDGDVARSPALDVAESDKAYSVKLDLPGVAKEDVKVSIDGHRVTVEAQSRKADDKKDGDRIVYRERSLSSYSRSFRLAREVDQGESSAKLENGVLTLTLVKRGAPATTQISVN
jgi:HSP20 family protein